MATEPKTAWQVKYTFFEILGYGYKNKQVFLRQLLRKTDEAGRYFIYTFYFSKKDEAIFYVLFDQNIMGHLFLFIFKEKNDNHLILASTKKKDEATFFKSEKDRRAAFETDEGRPEIQLTFFSIWLKFKKYSVVLVMNSWVQVFCNST